ncbi:hypothetical protein LOK49_LG11G00300 [Camellia lanceoleosa]|uniref:Uncharacterized protein n=1 Tax=Camellia lanceoleosa TaxID=1840588 RepID=A0ACC0G2F1_9ERIC|nr:hypothetical protein LOK49_LG11G00300 [Camellia lanceoleosa]
MTMPTASSKGIQFKSRIGFRYSCRLGSVDSDCVLACWVELHYGVVLGFEVLWAVLLSCGTLNDLVYQLVCGCWLSLRSTECVAAGLIFELNRLVKEKRVDGWDDPALMTLSGLCVE